MAAFDIAENVGIIDSFFKNSKFFFKFKEFDKFLKQNRKKIHYLVICAPNFLHYFYIKLGITYNINVICVVSNENQIRKPFDNRALLHGYK